MTAERQDESDLRAEFVEQQQSGLGATDSPKILGLSRWGSALTVYDRLVNGPTGGDMSLPAWLGLKLESTVAELYTTATGNKVRAANQHYRHPEHDWMVCHLDFRVQGNPTTLVECKTRAYMKGYGEDGSAEIPADVWVQVQHEMAVVGAEETHVAVLFGHHTFRVYVIMRDNLFIEKLIDRLGAFWRDHYLARVPPEPGPIDGAYLAREHPDDDGSLKAATPEQEAIVAKLRLAITNYRQAETSKAEVENQLKDIIGDAAGLVGAFGKITWKKSKDRESVDWEQVAITCGNVIEELFELVNPGDDDDLVSRLRLARSAYETSVSLNTSVKPGSRRFLVDLTEGA